MTKHYYGTKQVTAWPEARDGRDGYAVRYEDGYTSWSPADAFEAAYKPNGSLDFAGALTALKQGLRVARSGWNGKGMWLALTPGSTFAAEHAKPGHAAKHRAEELRHEPCGRDDVPMIVLAPHIDMRAADGTMVVGWLASQTDMLAEDWQVLALPVL